MSDDARNPVDARYCPSCGRELSPRNVRLYADETLNTYRATLDCSECGYSGEVIRAGGIEDMTLHGDSGLWCGKHGQYEPEENACEGAFNPDTVDWLEAADE